MIRTFSLFAIVIVLLLSRPVIGTETNCEGLNPAMPLSQLTIIDNGEFGDPRTGGNTHKGTDYKAEPGTPVYAIAKGVIRDAQVNTYKWGHILVLQHAVTLENGTKIIYHSLYAHLQEQEVKDIREQIQQSGPIAVERGAPLLGAKTGTSGNAQGTKDPHLHLEIIKNCVFKPTYRKCNPQKINPKNCLQVVPDFDITYVYPGPGDTIRADRTVFLRLIIEPENAQVPDGTLIEIWSDGNLMSQQELDRTGHVTVRSSRFPNIWKVIKRGIGIQLKYGNTLIDDTSFVYNVEYNWSAINRGPWQITYDWTYNWKSKQSPSHTALEHHTGTGYIGSQSYYNVAPFNETFARTAWVNEYDFKYDDMIGCTYVSIGPSGNLVHFRLFRRSCFDPPTENALRTGMKAGFIMPETGLHTFDDPDERDGQYMSELGFRLVDGDHHPEIFCSRTVDTETYSSIWSLKYSVYLRRIPFPEWYESAEKTVVQTYREPEISLPADMKLQQNSPNPFNPVTNISFSLPVSARVKLEIYNILGEKIETLINADYDAGEYSISWNASKYPSGIYLYRLHVDDQEETRKMILLK